MLKKKWATTTMAFCLAANTVLMAACGGSASTQETKGADQAAGNQEGTKTEQTGTQGQRVASDFSGRTIEIATYLSGDTLNAYKLGDRGF